MDDILIKDKSGQLKILRNGNIVDVKEYITEKKLDIESLKTKTEPTEEFVLGDEQDIKQYEDKKQDILNLRKREYLEMITTEIINEGNIVFEKDSELLAKRLRNIILARLNNVRSAALTRDILARDVASGGLGLSLDKVEKVIGILADRESQITRHAKRIYAEYAKGQEPQDLSVEVYKEEIAPPPPALNKLRQLYEAEAADHAILADLSKRQQPKPAIEAGKPKIEQQTEIQKKKSFIQSLSDVFKKKPAMTPAEKPVLPPVQPKIEPKETVVAETTKQPAKILETPKEALPLQPVPKPAEPAVKAPVMPEQKKVSLPPKPPVKPMEMPKVTKLPPAKPLVIKTKSDQPTLRDIVPPEVAFKEAGMSVPVKGTSAKEARLVGEVEEMSLNLKDFRRIAADPQIRVNKILEILNRLEERSFTDRIKGIESWKRSEVFSLYLEMGYESMTNGVPIEQIIADRDNNKMPFLTKEEFDSIVDLNKLMAY